MESSNEELRPAGEPEEQPALRGNYQGKRIEPGSTVRRLWKDYGYLVITAAVILFLFKVIFQIAWVPSGSMETTLPTKSVLISWQLPYLCANPTPERGDVITFWNDELDELLVKRVIGLPGDTITIKNGFVYLNGEKLDESYLPRQGGTDYGKQESYTVPEGCLFMMGDNRASSYDARYWNDSYIPIENVRSHVLLCISVLNQNCWRGIHAIS